MSVTGLSCMFQRGPARASAETGGVISVHLSLFLPPAGLSFSLISCHTVSLSYLFLSCASQVLLRCVSSVTLHSSFPPRISCYAPHSCGDDITATKHVFIFKNAGKWLNHCYLGKQHNFCTSQPPSGEQSEKTLAQCGSPREEAVCGSWLWMRSS